MFFKSTLASSTTYRTHRELGVPVGANFAPVDQKLPLHPPACSIGNCGSESAGNAVSWARFWPRSPHEVTILIIIVTQEERFALPQQPFRRGGGGRGCTGRNEAFRDTEWNILRLCQYLLATGLKRLFSVFAPSAY